MKSLFFKILVVVVLCTLLSLPKGPSPNIYDASTQENEHAVLVYIKLSGGLFGQSTYYKLEDKLEESIIKHGVGEFDGNGRGEGYWTIFMYGPDANKLFEVIAPIIKEADLPAGSYIIKIYGAPGSQEERIDIDAMG